VSGNAPRSPLDAEDLRARVHKVIDGFLQRQQPILRGISEDLGPVVDALVELLHGGKRLRPAFCYWGWRGAGGGDGEEIVTAATSLELFQACALTHDDVMDGSDTRRGLPSVHRRFATTHRAAGWRGSPDAFGTGAAILLGDMCLTWSDQLFYESGLPAAALARARPVFDLMRTEVMVGQYLDLLEQALGGGSAERAMRVVRFKSAKYTVERPLHLGALLAGAGPEMRTAYSEFGLPLGEAFQLRDDILGVFGDPAETGKPAGDDLREGKRTVLVATALALARGPQAAIIETYLGDPTLDVAGVARLREVIVETGALAETERLIDQLTGRALDALERSLVTGSARGVLAGLALAATTRRG
jgi:geranylgeranyl diphosphate synthase type I